MGNLQTSIRKSHNKDLERYCKPTGLYSSCPWDTGTVRKWILDGKVAPRFPSIEDSDSHNEECPICFMGYIGVNTTQCCKKPLCTECYLQLKPPRSSVSCPFCNSHKFSIVYNGPLSDEDRNKKWEDEQRVIEAKIRASREDSNQETSQSISRENQLRNNRESVEPLFDIQGESQSFQNISLATVDSRRELEESLRLHQMENGDNSNVTRLSNVRRESDRSLEDLVNHFGMPSLLSAITRGARAQEIEEVMIQEAIRNSLGEGQMERNLTRGPPSITNAILEMDTHENETNLQNTANWSMNVPETEDDRIMLAIQRSLQESNQGHSPIYMDFFSSSTISDNSHQNEIFPIEAGQTTQSDQASTSALPPSIPVLFPDRANNNEMMSESDQFEALDEDARIGEADAAGGGNINGPNRYLQL
eukprot:CAMPEP_0171452710 /NCGR_PEP_ID=MMETSP0945-20130129/708_1 /TAXON_ID=109269 /ORGANISM="Vaucheria litorea, Strain CCMP2940" /LENGTH=418 /DNA_ID=CAMNT_0011977429 /DNA_START=96 /DNA_END=1352 /DNA_ORIENTATION=+